MKRLVYLLVVLTLTLVGLLLVYGGLYGTNFVKDNLAEQKIYFPSEAALVGQARSDLVEYSDMLVDNGKEAKAYASYIQGHLEKIADGRTYSEVSSEYNALEDKTTDEALALEDQRMSLFMGEMLRGTLLNAYGWSLVSSVALVAGAIVLVGAAFAAIDYLMGMMSFPKRAKRASSKKNAKKRK